MLSISTAILVAVLPGFWQFSYKAPTSDIWHTLSGMTYEQCVRVEANVRNYEQTDDIDFISCTQTTTNEPEFNENPTIN